jgi:hypothetical protein
VDAAGCLYSPLNWLNVRDRPRRRARPWVSSSGPSSCDRVLAARRPTPSFGRVGWSSIVMARRPRGTEVPPGSARSGVGVGAIVAALRLRRLNGQWASRRLPPAALVLMVASLLAPAMQPIATQAAIAYATPASNSVDLGNPSHNDTQLFVAMDTACRPGGTSCRSASLTALDTAREQEGLRPMVWPATFWDLPDREQLLIAFNQERTARKLLPIRGLTAQLDLRTRQAAVLGADPTYRGDADWSGIWAQADNALFADFLWMYEDGYSTTPQFGQNLDCRPGDTAGCWGHRKAILYRWPERQGWQLAMGATCVVPTIAPGLSCAAIFVDRPGDNSYQITWKRARELGA